MNEPLLRMRGTASVRICCGAESGIATQLRAVSLRAARSARVSPVASRAADTEDDARSSTEAETTPRWTGATDARQTHQTRRPKRNATERADQRRDGGQEAARGETAERRTATRRQTKARTEHEIAT